MSMDINNFLRGLDMAEKKIREAARRGMAKAGFACLHDAEFEVKAVPHDEGTLAGSGSVHVDGKFIGASQNVGGAPTPMTDPVPGPDNPNIVEGTVGFNTPYAAYQHEGMRRDGTHVVKNYTTPGTGTKYLESKLSENRDKYLGIVANEIRTELGP